MHEISLFKFLPDHD